jgi:hypothetical protein
VNANARSTSTLTKNHYSRGITAKKCDILMHPAHRLSLVFNTVISNAASLVS